MPDEVLLAEYDPRWPNVFATEAAILRTLTPPGLMYRIEHFGSTAVPGLASKPIIDILVGVISLDEAVANAVPPLEAIGYSFWRDNPDQTRLFLVKGLPPNGPRTHHLHVVESDSLLWERLSFRDYLRAHPAEAERYADLKRHLASEYPDDREAYTDAKSAYVADVTARARAWAVEGAATGDGS